MGMAEIHFNPPEDTKRRRYPSIDINGELKKQQQQKQTNKKTKQKKTRGFVKKKKIKSTPTK